MKTLLALAVLALTALMFEEKARELAGEAQTAMDGAAAQAREAKQSLVHQVEQQPVISLLVAGAVAYALATIIPTRS